MKSLSRTNTESCQYCDEFKSTIVNAEDFLKKRKAVMIDNEGTLTVKVGPRNEQWTEKFSTSEEWKHIKKSVYKVPNVELRSAKDFEPYDSLETLEEKMRLKYVDQIRQV